MVDLNQKIGHHGPFSVLFHLSLPNSSVWVISTLSLRSDQRHTCYLRTHSCIYSTVRQPAWPTGINTTNRASTQLHFFTRFQGECYCTVCLFHFHYDFLSEIYFPLFLFKTNHPVQACIIKCVICPLNLSVACCESILKSCTLMRTETLDDLFRTSSAKWICLLARYGYPAHVSSVQSCLRSVALYTTYFFTFYSNICSN